MTNKKKSTCEYRHYDVPKDLPVLALLGDGWIRMYEQILHFHNQLEIGYCYWGMGDILIEDKVYPFSPGTVTLIPRNVPHSTDGRESLSKWEYLFIDMDEFAQFFNESPTELINSGIFPISTKPYIISREQSPIIRNLVLQVLDEMRFHKNHFQLSVISLMFAFLIEVSRLKLEVDTEEFDLHSRSSIHILPALEYISENYGEPISICELADMCHMSETHFRRLFNSIMSVSPLDYINKTRIHSSCNLLRSTDDSVLSIAIKTGFTTVTTFNRNFNKVVGTTPLKWRNDPENIKKNLKNYNIKKLEGWF